jgi:predicted transcriptional regulator
MGTFMLAATLTIRLKSSVKKRLDKLAKRAGRSRSALVAEAIDAFLDLNEWQVSGIERAIASLDRGGAIPHEAVKAWIGSWGSDNELAPPTRSSRNRPL